MPSAVTLRHPNGAYVEVRPSDVAECLSRGFTETESDIPAINHAFVHTRIDRHKGRPALILGNGPSLRGIPPNAIRAIQERHNAIVVGCNNMFDPWRIDIPCVCDYWVILDKHFWWENKDKINGAMQWMRDQVCKEPVLVLHCDPQRLMVYERIVVDTAHQAMYHTKYNPDVYPHGSSSGVAGIAHALHMGCNPLYLIGHDLTLDHMGNTHSYGVRDSEKNGYAQGNTMLPGYEVMAMWARQLGREIWNLSPISRIPSFPLMTVDQLMKG